MASGLVTAMASGLVTNGVQVPLPIGAKLSATRETFRHFGQIASIEMIPENGLVLAQILFFDVRAAVSAVEALASMGCVHTLHSDNRSVHLPGGVELEAEDLSRISGVSRDADDGSYIVEFFDIRDASRYQEKRALDLVEPSGAADLPGTDVVAAPPGLGSSRSQASPPGLGKSRSQASVAPPPGLEMLTPLAAPATSPSPPGLGSSCSLPFLDLMEPPPGLSLSDLAPLGSIVDPTTASSSPRQGTEVVIRGLPSAILTNMLMTAVIQQAGLTKDLIDLRLEAGVAWVTLAGGQASAQRCVRHFQGRQWGASGGDRVTVDIVPEMTDFTLSAEAPVFVPSWAMPVAPAEKAVPEKCGVSSNASTGDSSEGVDSSEGEDEKEIIAA